MNDTPFHITKKLCEMWRKKSLKDRYDTSWSMYQTSKQLLAQAIKASQPNITEAELKKKMFLHLYHNDFDEIRIKKILAHLDER